MRSVLFCSIWMTMYTCDSCNPPTGGGGGGGSSTGNGPTDDNLASASGDFALDYLRDDTYKSLLVEVDYVLGRAPTQAALDALQEALEKYCDKPDGIGIVVDDAIPSQGAPVWTYEAAEDLEVAWRDEYHDAASGEAVLYFLYIDGRSDGDNAEGSVLAYAYHGSSIVMFKDTITASLSGPPLVRNSVEPSVIVHELGHNLGLVNNGIPMIAGHEDPTHLGHDANTDCLMYWAVSTSHVSDLIHNGPPVFDAQCEADLSAARGG